MARRYFTGFSTLDSDRTRNRTFYDLELCKRDLMNHFHTRRGERVMRPQWGCAIWDYLMEPLTDGIREIIIEEATSVINADARCQLVDVNVAEFEYGIAVIITMNFVPENVVSTFTVEFDTRNAKFFQ